MIPGIEITDGARTFTVAPMNLRIMLCEPTKALVDRISQGPGDDVAGFQNAAIDLLLACVKRNHPDATRDDILDMVNVADLGGILTGVMSNSGLRPRPLEPTPTPSP
jgi:hypothetical protein